MGLIFPPMFLTIVNRRRPPPPPPHVSWGFSLTLPGNTWRITRPVQRDYSGRGPCFLLPSSLALIHPPLSHQIHCKWRAGLTWKLYFAALHERTLGSTTGAERRAGNWFQDVVGRSSLPSLPLLWLSREYRNRSQIHECRNWEQGRAVSFLGFVSNFQYNVG